MLSLLFAFILGSVLAVELAAQGNITIFGRVVLPDGQPASRARVKVVMSSGFNREVITDDQGRYEMQGILAGRYQFFATNPDAPEQVSERAESDSTRSYANRLQVDLYLRLPMHSGKREAKPGTVNVAEAAQNIPKPARKAYDQGMKLQKENQAEKALVAFNQAIELYPEYFQALTERANLLMQQNKLREAEADFNQALKFNAKYPSALRGIGYCQIQQKMFAVALGNLEKSYALEPNVPLTLLLLGYANLSLDRYEEAKQCLQQALKIGPEVAARAHVYLAEVYAHEQKFTEAADAIRAYLKAKPDAADAASLRKMEADWRARGKR
jgi:tetratricopeptide (TPR) repeat protein